MTGNVTETTSKLVEYVHFTQNTGMRLALSPGMGVVLNDDIRYHLSGETDAILLVVEASGFRQQRPGYQHPSASWLPLGPANMKVHDGAL